MHVYQDANFGKFGMERIREQYDYDKKNDKRDADNRNARTNKFRHPKKRKTHQHKFTTRMYVVCAPDWQSRLLIMFARC